jgi:pectinesterase
VLQPGWQQEPVANGKGSIAHDLTIANTTGSSKHQVVALHCVSVLPAFYRCTFEGYRDTLYVHSLREFTAIVTPPVI